ncbi:MAG: esterase/lipase family protein [Planctomycetaceae bacterium]
MSPGSTPVPSPPSVPYGARYGQVKLRLLVIFVLLNCVFLAGCSSTRYLASRSNRENALETQLALLNREGPKVSERTWNALKRFGLTGIDTQHGDKSLESIRNAVDETNDAELIYALSELAYVEGKRAERKGNASAALNFYGIALTNSYDYLFSEDLEESRNQYDPQFRGACELYNESLEDTLRLLCTDNKLRPNQTYTIQTPDRSFSVRTAMRGAWDADEFDHYEFVSDYNIQTLHNRHTTYGLGVPLIAVRKPLDPADPRERYYPDGLSYAVTALMRCTAKNGEKRLGGAPDCILEFYDPLTVNQIQLASRWVPLETDLTTPLAFFLDSPEFRRRNRATEGLLDPNKTQSHRGLYMIEPYDPKRIPVVMVHGLWSSPLTWMDMFNDLRSYPEVRNRYQFWFYLYPSGQPFWISATELRKDLADMRSAIDRNHQHAPLDQMVLVGHSMGGLVSRMQTMDSGDDFWQIVSDKPPDQIRGSEEDRIKLVSTLYFNANPSIRRVVTIGTPHAGSEFANDYTRWVARKLIRLPQMAVATAQQLASQNPGLFRDNQLLTVSNAIDSLAPESPIFPVMARAKKSSGVTFHNIIGVTEDRTFLSPRKPSDGIVDLASARSPDAVSEVIVNSEHTQIHTTDKAILEVRRILLEHVREIDSQSRVALVGGE